MAIPRRILTTARLRLEPLSVRIAPAVWGAIEPSLPELRPWLGWTAWASLETTADFAADAERQWREGTGYQFAVHDDEGVAGGVGLTRPFAGVRRAEIGYWIRSDRTGRGYATEACRAVIAFAFGIGIHRIELRAGTGNLASRRVAEKLGFKREGLLRDSSWGSDAPYDCELYGLLATDEQPAG